jgi:hypothetical protein
MTAVLLSRNSAQKRATGEASFIARLLPQPRIEPDIGEVDEEIDGDEDEGDKHQIGDHHRPVERLDGVDDQLADAGPGEDRLGHDREGERRGEFEPEDGDERDRDQAQHMAAQHGPFGEAGSTGEFHGVGEHGLARAGPREACHQSELEEGEVERRQQQMAQAVQRQEAPLDAEDGDRLAAPAGRQPLQFDGEGHDQHEADPEGRHGEAEDRDRHDQLEAKLSGL